MNAPFRLTSLAQGGGPGFIDARSLRLAIRAKMPEARCDAKMMVGIGTGDDAVVYRSNVTQALIADSQIASRPA